MRLPPSTGTLGLATNNSNTTINIYDDEEEGEDALERAVTECVLQRSRLPRWDEGDPQLYGAIKTLITEK